MNLGSTKELAENKLILLYVIDKLSLPVSNLQITKLILENKFMNYFLLQQFLNELCESNLLSYSEAEDKKFYKINDNGKQTLSYFINLIPFGIKNRIDNTINQIRKSIRNETLITADYTPESETEFVVSCKINEDNFSLVDLNVTVGTKNDALTICENWKKHSQAIYSEIIDILIKKRD
ncbi:MAG TPA: DUF4364 family protein [Clostridia bacterium]|nr:DUF4364 family protein [Clostridia bacterium]